MDSIMVQFKAGLLVLQDGKLHPDTRKGLIRIVEDEAGLVHFCWHERDAASGAAVGGKPPVDVVVIPGECEFAKMARPGGSSSSASRVFELRFPEERARNLFFWAQEADAGRDDANVAAVNAALSQEEPVVAVEGGMEAPAPPQGQAGGVVAMQTDAPAAGGGGGGAVTAAQLAAVLGSMLGGGGAGPAPAQAADPGPSLSEVLRPEVLAPLLQSPAMLERLAPHLPEGHRSAADVAELVATPQFRHQLAQFSAALQSGQLDGSQFGLPPSGGYGVLPFLRAVQQKADEDAAATAAAAGAQQQPGGDGDSSDAQPPQ